MQKSLTRLFTAVLMAALLISASIMSVSAAEVNCNGHDGWTEISEGGLLIDKGGNYVLTADITSGSIARGSNVTSSIAIDAGVGTDVVICLNGYAIAPSEALDNALRIETGDVTICNCQAQAQEGNTIGNGVIKGNKARTIQLGLNWGTPKTTLTLEDNVHIDGAGSEETPLTGPAIQVANDAAMTLNSGATVSNNTVANNTVTVMGGKVVMNAGAEIKGNTATQSVGQGGAFKVSTYGSIGGNVTINGGEISGNTATRGGAIYAVDVTSSVTINDGTIKNNTTYINGDEASRQGSNIYAMGGTVNFSGGSIFNEEDDAPHEIYVGSSATLNMSEDAHIKGTIGSMTGAINITGGTIDGSVSNMSAAKIAISGGKFSAVPSASFLKMGYFTKEIDEAPYICQVIANTVCPDHSVGWIEIKDASNARITKAGSYVVTANLTAGATGATVGCITVDAPANAEVIICLNGKNLSPSSVGAGLHVRSGKVTLHNCSGTVSTIKAGTSRGICVGDNNGDTVGEADRIDFLTINGKNIVIDGNKAGKPAIEIFREGHAIMNGGIVKNSTSGQGAVWVRGGIFQLEGDGAITSNSTSGVKVDNASAGEEVCGEFIMNGGTISGNNATNMGGGVWVQGKNAKFNMKAGTISGNTASNNGGGVMVGTDRIPATMIMEAGAVIDGNTSNSASNGGGGICTYSTSTLTINGGTISNNKSPNGNGGGINVGGSTTFVMKNVTMFGNTAKMVDGLNLVAGSGSATISGGTFYSNVNASDTTNVAINMGSRSATISAETADLSVKGEVRIADTKCTISGGKFSANTARATLASKLATDKGMLSVMNIDEDGLAYEVRRGFANVGEHMDFKSSLGFSLILNADANFTSEGYEYFNYTAISGNKEYDVTASLVESNLMVTASGVAAKEMQDAITFTVKDGETVLYSKTLSVYDAAQEWAKEAGKATLVADMINYGAAAQSAFGYGEGKTMTGSGEVTEEWNTNDASVPDAYADNIAVSLNLKERIELNIYVNSADVDVAESDAYDVTKVNGNTVTRITFDKINVKDVKTPITLTLTVDGQEITITYSVEAYVAAAAELGQQEDLMIALQKYVDSVCAYTGN